MDSVFHFKQFDVCHGNSAQKVTTDSVLLGSWVATRGDEKRILDVGAGNGLLALMMAQRCPDAEVTAVEIDVDSAGECENNFRNSPWANRLELVVGDFTKWESGKCYDLIISNPPYFREDTLSHKEQRNIARHETGLNIDSLLRMGRGLLESDGSLALVCPWRERQRVVMNAELYGFGSVRECEVSTVEGREPALSLFQLRLTPGENSTERLAIRDTSNVYTDEYKDLTFAFYKFLH